MWPSDSCAAALSRCTRLHGIGARRTLRILTFAYKLFDLSPLSDVVTVTGVKVDGAGKVSQRLLVPAGC
jgi:hypothetical protein